MTAIKINANSAMQRFTFKVQIRGLGMLRARVWLGRCLFRLGAWVMGAAVSIEVVSERVAQGAAYDQNGVPLRMSIDDPTFDPEEGSRIEVLLDGVVQNEVLEFDCEAGFVRRYVTENGQLVLDRDRGEIAQETLFGEVAARWKSEP